MGRKSQRRCLGMRFMVIIPILIVAFPPLWVPSFSSFSIHPFSNALRSWMGWNTSDIAETIFSNGVIWTGDPHLPWANSLSISRGRIVSTGSLREVQKTAGLKTRYVDLQGRFVTPGFIDSHVHFIPSGIKLGYLDMNNVHTRAEFVKKVEMAAFGLSKGRWILGDNWQEWRWGGDYPEASWIDAVTPDNPVWMNRADGHMGLANSYALKLAGIGRSTVDPEGGKIIRDSNGVPTGLLAEGAMAYVFPFIPPFSVEERREGRLKSCSLALSQGITSVIDFGSYIPGESKDLPWSDLNQVYLKADSLTTPCTRVNAFMPLATWPRVKELMEEKGRVLNDWLRIGGVKEFADGSLGSGTAYFHEAYADDPSNRGGLVVDVDWLQKTVTEADEAGLQVAIHVIGDAAIDLLLSVVDAVNSTNGPRDRRFRLEHVQHMSPGAPARVGASGVIASVQPLHLLDDANFAARKLGEDRAIRGSYSFSSLIGNGTRLALGSDWNVAPLDALSGMKAAVTRTPPGWDSPWIGVESIPIEVALRGYTVDAAYAGFMDDDVGSLAPGKLADFVVLTDNVLTSPPNAWPTVWATYVGGVLAYATSSFTS